MTSSFTPESVLASFPMDVVDQPTTPTVFAYPQSFPGFGLPLNYYDTSEGEMELNGRLLANALTVRTRFFNLPMVTIQESMMLQFMDAVTDKEDWFSKVKRPEIADKWKAEITADQPEDGVRFTREMADWCIEELRHNANSITNPTRAPPVFVYNGDIYKSDNALSPSFKVRLQEEILSFEARIPEGERDWHPGSDGRVWDLVHPSLFPVIFGRTRVLPGDEKATLQSCLNISREGEILPIPSDEELVDPGQGAHFRRYRFGNPILHIYSKQFQWIPCEIDISTGEARITSYINNLHPIHNQALYHLIEQVISAAIPLWERTLAFINPARTQSVRNRIPYDRVRYDFNPDFWPEVEGPQIEIGESIGDFDERRDNWCQEPRVLAIPNAGTFTPIPRPRPLSLRDDYSNRGLQVIVKLANIQLRPEKSSYDGGTWHVEGQINEHIVATAIYYYSSDNITTSRLSFRHTVDSHPSNIRYPQNHHAWLSDLFDCRNEEPGVQHTGSVVTREGRLITFPNILQHRVGPFELEDKTKPGHRKIVALFLVDPNMKILSTAKIPCQRQDWWKEELEKNPALAAEATGRSFEDFPIGMDEAKEYRLKLMEERTVQDQHQREEFQKYTFSLCEH